MYWLSESFYTLFSEGEPLPQTVVPSAEMTADVVVVGSGYGGAIAAQKIAQALKSTTSSVLLLERGKEYVPGEFPEDVDELPAHVHIRNPRGSKGVGYSTSLFQIYPADTAGSGQVSVIVGNALGGGSQINANVAKEPHASVFAHAAWPHPLRDAGLDVLRPHFDAVRHVLGARPIPVAHEPSKHAALRRLHAQFSQPGRLPAGYRAEFESPDLAVTFQSGESVAGIAQSACIGCGNCCSGCNTGAKNTLTMNYLPLAKQAGARIVTQAQVHTIRRLTEGDGYELEVHPAQALAAPDEDRRLLIRARIVVLAAGALGSTEVFLRSSQLREHLSDRLGERFSTNGDSICARYDTDRPVHAMGLGLRAEHVPANERPGPTISGAIRIVPEFFEVGQAAKALPSFTIEDCAIPLALADLGAELLGSTAALRSMQASFYQEKRRPGEDPLGSSAAAALNSEVYLTMAHDSASGTIVVDSQGALRVAWPDNSIAGREPAQNDPAQSVLNTLLAGSHGQGGRYIPNPVREPLPKEMTAVMSNMPQAGLVTVHPLGGCSMGDDVSAGVVDHRGRVFDKLSSGVLDGLYVLDGSIVPCSLETNPFLTISALADRAVDQLIDLDLARLCAAQAHDKVCANQELPKLPVVVRNSNIQQAAATQFIFRERLRTPLASVAELTDLFPKSVLQELVGARANNLFLQLDLSYSPPDLHAFLASDQHACDLRGQLSLYRRRLSWPAYSDHDWELLADPVPIEAGRIRLFHILESASPASGLRAGWVYLRRRLLRENRLPGGRSTGLRDLKAMLRFLSHVGTRRAVSYTFSTHVAGKVLSWTGRKDISYRQDSNVWNDLFTLPLKANKPDGATVWDGRLNVDLGYFLGDGAPQVQKQQSLVHAMVDFSRYLLLYLRVVGQTYFYEFGPPDYPARSEPPMRLPGALTAQGMPVLPEHYWLPVVDFHQTAQLKNRNDGLQFEQALAQLPARPNAQAPSDGRMCMVAVYHTAQPSKGAVVLLHGYAISSSMWASANASNNFVQSLLEAGYDAYVADLRTSSAMADSCNLALGFDDIAAQDIPCLIEFAVQKNRLRFPALASGVTTDERIRVVAHCMGSAQFSMAVLGQSRENLSNGGACLAFVPTAKRIRQACFFQVAPLMTVTPANASRGKAAALFDAFIGNQMVGPWLNEADKVGAGLAFLNRIAMTFPFAADKDPGRPDAYRSSPWVGVMRKAFWMYGETWDNANVGPSMRAQIHDMIGPVNLKTYRQVGQFVRQGRVVDAQGRADLANDLHLRDAYGEFDSLWLHGERSGMFDKQTTAGMAARLRALFQAHPEGLQPRVEFKSLTDFGHLDSVISDDAQEHSHRDVLSFFNNCFDGSSTEQQLEAYRPADLGAKWPVVRPQEWSTLATRAAVGPFQTRVESAQIRVWFFSEAALATHTSTAFVLALKPDAGQPIWGVWLSSNAALADLHQYVVQVPDSVVPPECTFVVGSLADRALVRRHAQIMDAQELAWLAQAGARLEREGSAVTLLNPTAAVGQTRAFLFGSCRYPGLLIDQEKSIGAFDNWCHLLKDASIESIVFAGDQVYVDALGNASGASTHADSLAQIYRTAFGAARTGAGGYGNGLTQLLRRLPLHCVVDDHEFRDNFSASSVWPNNARETAFQAMALFQGPAMPSYLYQGPRGVLPEPGKEKTLSGSLQIAGCDSFLLDTRLGRNRAMNRLVDDQGWEALERWAARCDKQAPKFIVSGSVLLPARLATMMQPAASVTDDSFNGYPQERQRLLQMIWKHRLNNIVLLSGDFHLSCAGRAWLRSADPELDSQDALAISFCVSSGLYAPLTFANMQAWELPPTGVRYSLPREAGEMLVLDFEIDVLSTEQVIAKIEVLANELGSQVFAGFFAADEDPIARTQLV